MGEMTVPSTIGQLMIALLLVLPGTVYQVCRARFRGPTPDDSSATNRILRALAFSAGLDALYVLLFGRHLMDLVIDTAGNVTPSVVREHLWPIGLWALFLLVGVPAMLAGAGAGLVLLLPKIRRSWTWIPRLSYDPTPRSWDFAFSCIEPCYVRVQLSDGTWLGGWYGPGSFASSYPEPRELFIERAYSMDSDGTFVDELKGTKGLYVRCEEIRSVEFLAPRLERALTSQVDGVG